MVFGFTQKDSTYILDTHPSYYLLLYTLRLVNKCFSSSFRFLHSWYDTIQNKRKVNRNFCRLVLKYKTPDFSNKQITELTRDQIVSLFHKILYVLQMATKKNKLTLRQITKILHAIENKINKAFPTKEEDFELYQLFQSIVSIKNIKSDVNVHHFKDIGTKEDFIIFFQVSTYQEEEEEDEPQNKEEKEHENQKIEKQEELIKSLNMSFNKSTLSTNTILPKTNSTTHTRMSAKEIYNLERIKQSKQKPKGPETSTSSSVKVNPFLQGIEGFAFKPKKREGEEHKKKMKEENAKKEEEEKKRNTNENIFYKNYENQKNLDAENQKYLDDQNQKNLDAHYQDILRLQKNLDAENQKNLDAIIKHYQHILTLNNIAIIPYIPYQELIRRQLELQNKEELSKYEKNELQEILERKTLYPEYQNEQNEQKKIKP